MTVVDQALACPVCGGPETELFRASADVAADVAAARRWWARHSRRGVDITRDEGLDVRRCRRCSSLWRLGEPPAEVVDAYREDHYPPGALDRLFRRGLSDYEHDRRWLVAQGLRPGARVLEIGFYAGAFLAFAAAHGCEAVGVDVGREVLAHGRRHGFDVRPGPFDAADFGAGEFDAVWVLNCFEQLPEPGPVLDGARRVLRPGGRLVVRTPDARFVEQAYRRPRLLRVPAVLNHVWGVPYLYCFTPESLAGLLGRHGFDDVSVRPREFAVVDPPDAPGWWRAARPVRPLLWRAAGSWPWMDVTACA